MASLALLASLVFIIVLLIGPVSYTISLLNWMPKVITYLLGLACILVGIWWFLLPIPAIRYYGLLDAFLGCKIIFNNGKKQTQG